MYNCALLLSEILTLYIQWNWANNIDNLYLGAITHSDVLLPTFGLL